MDKKDNWIDDLFEDLEGGIKRATPDAFFLKKMESKVLQNNETKVFSIRTFWAIAASLTLLITANFYVIKSYQNSAEQDISETYTYSLIPINDIYNG